MKIIGESTLKPNGFNLHPSKPKDVTKGLEGKDSPVHPVEITTEDRGYIRDTGMSLSQYYAGLAMQSLLRTLPYPGEDRDLMPTLQLSKKIGEKLAELMTSEETLKK